ncbi:MerR family transcriptional regulator [Streptomyces gibsoniae]|uniref:MerR family transcriptional regulator n=1 Tax=Streptomyces gibsoniae TaxID=3075529 RepID=A0ABU2TV40_9ACTN|nr:MerR family transcriptional regulator [Streptomyces sp. DSM 41699]MDT0464826.1 MerR family transcriptional regulator [Streptomyces sp. DSM 41699]
MKIGELAAQAGVSVRALRYYEERGLLRSERTPAGRRTYPDGALERVLFIQQLFAAGLASRTIITILPCIDTGKLSTDQLALLTSEMHNIEKQIETLTETLARLADLIEVSQVDTA